MPKLSNTAGEETRDDKIGEEVTLITPTIAVTPMVMITCGVNRKVNTGNYENIDLYTAITLPLPDVGVHDMDALREMVKLGAEIGFGLASRETGERQILIKEAQRAGRQSVEPAPE